MATFGREWAERVLRERLDSLDNDTRRCFWPIPGGPGPAFFPAVLYGFATIDYSETPPLVFIGEYMEFDDLHFSNLRQFDGWS